MIAATSIGLVNWVKDGIKEFVEIIDLGEIYWLLGIKWKRDCEAGKLMLSQWSYISALLHWFGLEDTKPISILMDPVLWLISDQSSKSTANIACMTNIPYQEAVGILMYATLETHSDITYSVQVLSRFSKNSKEVY